MRIANIIEEGRFGGPQNRILQVAKKLGDFGVETTVILPKANSGKFQNMLKEDSIPYRPLTLSRLAKGKKDLLRYLGSFPFELLSLYTLFRKSRFDVVHCSGGAWSVKGIIAARLAGTPVLWHLNDTMSPWPVRLLFRMLRHMADGFIVSGRRVEEYYLKDSWKNSKPVFEVPPPVDCNLFDPGKGAIGTNPEPHSGVTILTVGNVNPVKGLEYFVEMARLLNDRYSCLSFIIAGSIFQSQEKYARKLFDRIKESGVDNIVFAGGSNNVRDLLSQADIFVCTSLSEAGPLSVWEAMAMEKAIVSTDVGDVSRYLEDGVTGFLVPAREPSLMAERVSRLVDSNELRKQFGTGARITARKSLDIDKSARSTLLAYCSMIGGGSVSSSVLRETFENIGP